MLTIDLGLASERIDTDPVAAKQLILEGQEQAREALAEIRHLVRGIAPSILLDRGLVPALESLSGRGSVPTVLVSDLPRERDFRPRRSERPTSSSPRRSPTLPSTVAPGTARCAADGTDHGW
ncbi:MAG: hypothetical protein C0498_08770 [Anaerolinea sp.]|nr:hypothetical protein [Anaerolinea sp.]